MLDGRKKFYKELKHIFSFLRTLQNFVLLSNITQQNEKTTYFHNTYLQMIVVCVLVWHGLIWRVHATAFHISGWQKRTSAK